MFRKSLAFEEDNIKQVFSAIGVKHIDDIMMEFMVDLDPNTFRQKYRLVRVSTTDSRDRFILQLYGINKLRDDLDATSKYGHHYPLKHTPWELGKK